MVGGRVCWIRLGRVPSTEPGKGLPTSLTLSVNPLAGSSWDPRGTGGCPLLALPGAEGSPSHPAGLGCHPLNLRGAPGGRLAPYLVRGSGSPGLVCGAGNSCRKEPALALFGLSPARPAREDRPGTSEPGQAGSGAPGCPQVPGLARGQPTAAASFYGLCACM